jgi:hypothetical protein
MQYAGSQYNGTGYSGQQQQTYTYPGQYYQQPPQPQPIQQQYSGQQQQYGSTPYAGTVPFPQPSPNTVPAVLQPPAPQQPVHRPARTHTPHPSVSRRRASSNATKRPIKSALKDPDRNRTSSVNGPLLSVPGPRTRRHSSGAENRPRMNSIVRSRTNSSSRTDPGTCAHIRVCRGAFHDNANFLSIFFKSYAFLPRPRFFVDKPAQQARAV